MTMKDKGVCALRYALGRKSNKDAVVVSPIYAGVTLECIRLLARGQHLEFHV